MNTHNGDMLAGSPQILIWWIKPMKYSTIMTSGFLILACVALSGCFGSGGGGSSSGGSGTTGGGTSTGGSGTTGGGAATSGGGVTGVGGGPSATFDSFQSDMNRVRALADTPAMPASLNATYSGGLRGTVGGTGGATGEIVGDLNLAVDWAEGMTARPFSGTASNLKGRQDGSATVTDIAGTLNVATDLPSAITRNTFGTNVTIPMNGDLTAGGETVTSSIILGGRIVGADAAAIDGTFSGGFNVGGVKPTTGVFNGGFITGDYYVDKN